jgi:protein arginine kinase
VSSRVRLARNFRGALFPGRIQDPQARELLARAREVFFSAPEVDKKDYVYVDVRELDAVDRTLMVEKHLASPDLMAGGRPAAVIMSKDEAVSVMLNEEDHLRVQCVLPSADIGAAYRACARVERVFDRGMEVAFDQEFGYLTSCPTNLGTGMRASFMLHLPALALSGAIKGILDACGKIGVAVRGIYGENSEAAGCLFQFSNQGSLGMSEEDILRSIQGVRGQIAAHERRLRAELAEKGRHKFEDRVFRALGTMENARVLTSEEFMRVWSDARMGADMGIIKEVGVPALDRMVTLIQPAYIQKMYGRLLNSEERDVYRALLVREMARGREPSLAA